MNHPDLMGQSFEDDDDNDNEYENGDLDDLSVLEQQQMRMFMRVISEFAEDIRVRMTGQQPVFLAPPNNFSYLVN